MIIKKTAANTGEIVWNIDVTWLKGSGINGLQEVNSRKRLKP